MTFSIQALPDPGDGAVVVTVAGEVDLATAPQLRQELLAQIEAGWRHVIVDMTDVTFLDSSGISALVAGSKGTRETGGSVSLRNPKDKIRRVLAITGVDRLFVIE